MSYPLLFVIVLHHNNWDDTFSCLDSLVKSDYKNFKIILLEGTSAVDSIEEHRRQFPQVRIITLPENLGYSGNNNIGLEAALEQGAEWILVLNNDTVLGPTCLSALIEVGETDPMIGILGPMVYHFHEPSIIQSAGGMLGKHWQSIHLGKNEVDEGQFRSIRTVEWVSGCAILVRRTLIQQIGLFDENYFLYWEETEYCLRAAKAGWKIFHVPHAKLWHKGVKRNYDPKPYVTYYMTRNYLFTLAKHNAPWTIRVSALMGYIKTLISWSIQPKWQQRRKHRNAMLLGITDFLRNKSGKMCTR